ncbi:MAG: hypothetical protein E6Q97_15035 [Desulfurellales bacterium]|nr:MAG: hypothetical protein E6Q97_15035 [Desulfurellales bacterium]
MIAYVNSGSPQASQLNALTSELDDILRVLFSNKSWLLYSYTNTGIPEGRRFYFGDAASRKVFPGEGEYDHATFTASAAAKTVTDTDVSKHLAFVEEGPTWDLDGSLEAHKQTVNVDGTDYDLYLCQVDVIGNVLSRERHRRIHVAEIIIEGWDTGVDFDFDSDWNKYHFLRFHNLDNEARTINLPGGSSIVVPAFGVQAVRRSYKLGSTWDTSYRYLWKAQSGDQLIFNHLNEGSTANNVASIQCFHDWLDIITDGVNPFRRGAFVDPRVCWDGSSLLPQAIDGTKRLGEYYHHLGDVLSFEDAAGTPLYTRGSLSSWSALEGVGSQGLQGTVSGNDFIISALAGRPTPVDAVGFGTTLLPSNIKTLPHTATTPPPVLALGGFKLSEAILEASYDPGSGVVNVDTTYDQAVDSFGWYIDLTATPWDTLNDIATLVAGDGGDEVATISGQAWKSDGWRLLATGDVVYDLTTCYQIDVDGVWDNVTWGTSSVSVPFGKDLFGRDSWMMTNRRQGRRISDWTENWHPDLEGGDGLDEGVDWNAARVAPSDSVVFKTEVPGTLAETNNLPVIQRADHADRLAANYETAGWYASNRASLLAGTTSGDTESIIRIPILREHYNHVAQRLNSIVSIRPFLFEDVLWYGELADGGWFSGGIPFAADYHAPVLSSGSRADDLGLTVYSLTRIMDIGPDQTNYYCKASEVADLAESLGFPYLMERLESPMIQTTDDDDLGFYSSLDFTEDWRQLGNRYVIADHVSVGYGRRFPPADWPQSGTSLIAPVVKHERIIKTVTGLPSSWTLNTESKLLIVPRPVLNWDNDTPDYGFDLSFTVQIDSDEPISVIDPITSSQVVWPSSDITGETDAAALAAILDESLPDGREAFEVALINRLYYRRT